MVGALTEVELGEEGIPDESDDDDCVSVNDYYDDNESINDQLNEEDDFHIDCIRQYIPPPPFDGVAATDSAGGSSTDIGNAEGFRWTTVGNLRPPENLSQRGLSTVKHD